MGSFSYSLFFPLYLFSSSCFVSTDYFYWVTLVLVGYMARNKINFGCSGLSYMMSCLRVL